MKLDSIFVPIISTDSLKKLPVLVFNSRLEQYLFPVMVFSLPLLFGLFIACSHFYSQCFLSLLIM